MIKVKDLMTTKVIDCAPSDSIRDAARIMYLNGLSGLPVLNKQGKLAGIITERQLVKLEKPLHIPSVIAILGSMIYLDNPLNGDEIEKQLELLTATKVEEVMSKDVITITSEESVENLAEIFLHKNVNPVPVVDGGKLVGIVSRADIVKLLSGEKDVAKGEWRDLIVKQ